MRQRIKNKTKKNKNKHTTETSASIRRWWWIYFFLMIVLRIFTTNIPEKCFFLNVGGNYLKKSFLSSAFESHWDLRGRTCSDSKHKKTDEDTGHNPSPGRHREFRHLWTHPNSARLRRFHSFHWKRAISELRQLLRIRQGGRITAQQNHHYRGSEPHPTPLQKGVIG